MKRLNYSWLCYGMTLAIVLAVAVLPISSWTFKNQLDILTGGWRHVGISDLDDTTTPVRLLEEEFKPITGPYNSVRPTAVGAYPRRVDYASVAAYARSHPSDPGSLATLVRWGMQAPYSSQESLLKSSPSAERNLRREDGAWAADAGISADPDNAFFWLAKAMILDEAGKTAEGYGALERAANCKRFDDYASKEPGDRYGEMLSRAGYRGEKPRVLYLSSVALPHFTSYKQYAVELASREPTKQLVQAQADYLRVCELMQRTGKGMMSVITSGTYLTGPILLPPRNQRDRGERPRQLVPYAGAFMKKQALLKISRPFDAKGYASATDRLRAAHFEAVSEPDNTLQESLGLRRTAASPALLLALVSLLATTAAICRIAPARESSRRILPFAVGLTALWVGAELDNREGEFQSFRLFSNQGNPLPMLHDWLMPLTLGCVLLASLQLVPRLRSWSVPLGLLASVGVILVTFPNYYIYVPAATFLLAVALGFLRKIPEAPVTGVLFVVCGMVGWLGSTLILNRPDDIWIVYTAIFGALLCATLLAAGSRLTVRMAPLLTVAFALVYLGSVARDIRENQALKGVLDGWEQQADLMRARAGISPR